MLFQRGVSVGMANAAASQAQPLSGVGIGLTTPSNYAAGAYPFYSAYNHSQYGHYFPQAGIPMENETPSTLQMHGNLYMPNAMSQMQYPTAPPQYVQYPHFSQPAPRSTTYQWPPANTNTETQTSAANNDGENH